MMVVFWGVSRENVFIVYSLNLSIFASLNLTIVTLQIRKINKIMYVGT